MVVERRVSDTWKDFQATEAGTSLPRFFSAMRWPRSLKQEQDVDVGPIHFRGEAPCVCLTSLLRDDVQSPRLNIFS
jgi:hypothetical protein